LQLLPFVRVKPIWSLSIVSSIAFFTNTLFAAPAEFDEPVVTFRLEESSRLVQAPYPSTESIPSSSTASLSHAS
jgi:hypothetical protein